MNKEIEDIRKLDTIIKEEQDLNTFSDEFDDFINYSISDDEPLEGVEEEELSGIEDAIDNIVDSTNQNIYHNVENLSFSADLNLVKHFLALEEIKIINVCKDVKLKKLLILNRAKHVQLQNIRYRLYELLKECKVSLKELEDELAKYNSKSTHSLRSIIPKLGHPYFKTNDFFSCAPNLDTVRRQKSQEICIDYLPQLSRWTIEDQILLKKAIISHYTDYLTEKYKSQLKTLEITKKISSDKDVLVTMETTISEIKEKLTELETNPNRDPPALESSDVFNWMSISKNDFANRHSAEACKAFWNIYLHPSINKTNWTQKENTQIPELAKMYNFQNWEKIAADLGNNRSGFAVCVHYYTTLSDKIRKDKFDAEEDQFLVDVVDACRIGNYIPWSKVSHYFQNRSRSQLYHRYKYNLKYSHMKKGSFSQAEDVLVVLLVRKFGKDFTRCSKFIPHRTPPQIAHRYKNYLMFDEIKLGCWTLEDDVVILDHVKVYGEKNWSKLFSTLKTKNRSHLRQRYLYLKKWLSQHRDKSLTDIPRKTKCKKRMDTSWAVKSCVERFSSLNEIPSLYDINENLKQLGQTPSEFRFTMPYRIPNDNIDKELVEYFQSTCKIRTSKIISRPELNHIVDVVKALMGILDVELIIPNNELLQKNQNLDILDVEILSLLVSASSSESTNEDVVPLSTFKTNCSVTFPTSSSAVCQKHLIKFFTPNPVSFLPPNINTLVGIRNLLLIHQSYKAKRSVKYQTAKLLNVYLQSTNSTKPETIDIVDETNLTITEKEKYIKRFNAIFKWPALMSIMEPKESLFVHKTLKKECTNTKEPRKVGRPKKNLRNIQLMNQARMNKKLLNQPSSSQSHQESVSDELVPRSVCTDKVNYEATQDYVHIATSAEADTKLFPIMKFETNDQIKRCSNSEIEKVDVKKIKTECINHNNELSQLREDIDKLDDVLMLELNKR